MTEKEIAFELIKETRQDVKELRQLLLEKTDWEQKKIAQFDKRLSKIEWKMGGFAIVFGAVGSMLWAKIKLIFGAH